MALVAPPMTPASPPQAGVHLVMPTSASAVSPRVQRPAPPRLRAKRASATPSPRMSPTKANAELDIPGANADDDDHDDEVSFNGDIVECTDEELARASRHAMQDALRRAWADRDKFLERLDEQDMAHTAAEKRGDTLQSERHALQAELDERYKEREQLEAELEETGDTLDLTRRNLDESERSNRQLQRRVDEQEKAFEAERLVYQAEKTRLESRLTTLNTERVPRPDSESSPPSALQDEVATLTASHQSLAIQLTKMSEELHALQSDSARLQEENESWQLLIEDRTLAGTMGGSLLSPQQQQQLDGSASNPTSRISTPLSERPERTVLETLDEQMEMDELHHEMDTHSYFPHQSSSPSKAASGGLSLAHEISAAPHLAEIEDLKGEVKALKESNRALSLYCTKILDRIMTHDGFEQVLASDYRSRRFGSRSGARPTAAQLAKAMESGSPLSIASPQAHDSVALSPVTAPVPAPTRARATSLLGALQSPLQTQPSSQLPGVKAPEPKTQDEKKGRRGFSIDFRSLGFGSTETKPEAKPQLKPLQLASRAAPANSNLVSNANVTSNTTYSPPMAANSILPAVAGGRKLELQEEDEEDRRERHRLEAALKLMGIDRTPPVENAPLPTPVATVPTPTSTTGSTSWFRFSRSRASTVSSAPASATTPSTAKPPSPPMTAAERVSSTPLSRMSSAFGDSSGSPLAPFVDLADSPDDPDKVAAALREYDAREQEQARLIAAGKGPAAYTSPPRPRRGSALSAMSPPRSPRALPHARGDSISTLWSMGSATESADDKDEEK